jgi:transcriptional repressor NrdR
VVRPALHLVARVPYLVPVHCPSCDDPDTHVVDSREAEDGRSIRRRRACDACGERFTTHERAESARIAVLKRDGSRQEFDRRKLASAIGKSAGDRLRPEKIAAIIDDIESTIRQSGAAEVPSGRIGEMVLERLATEDPMSWIRFKIVYSRLDDPDALYDELAQLVRLRESARSRAFAEQIALPIAEPVGAAAATRRQRRR